MNKSLNTYRQLARIRRSWIEISPTQLCQDKLSVLSKQKELLRTLLQWVVFPDYSLVPQLRELGALVESVYQLTGKMDIYRGFDPSGQNGQNTMGLGEGAKPTEIVHTYEHSTRALSYSTDCEIARSYGQLLVHTVLDFKQHNALVITDELAHLISEMKGEVSQTQKEVIVLPPLCVRFRILET